MPSAQNREVYVFLRGMYLGNVPGDMLKLQTVERLLKLQSKAPRMCK